MLVADFAQGSMGLKVAAAKRFATLTGKIVRKDAGTWIEPGEPPGL